jgi:hypothetical protein
METSVKAEPPEATRSAHVMLTAPGPRPIVLVRRRPGALRAQSDIA